VDHGGGGGWRARGGALPVGDARGGRPLVGARVSAGWAWCGTGRAWRARRSPNSKSDRLSTILFGQLWVIRFPDRVRTDTGRCKSTSRPLGPLQTMVYWPCGEPRSPRQHEVQVAYHPCCTALRESHGPWRLSRSRAPQDCSTVPYRRGQGTVLPPAVACRLIGKSLAGIEKWGTPMGKMEELL